jgi:hypothetical protein
MVVESAEDFVISVADHDGAEGEAHDEEREGLQAVEVAQTRSSGERNIDYSRGTEEGSRVVRP